MPLQQTLALRCSGDNNVSAYFLNDAHVYVFPASADYTHHASQPYPDMCLLLWCAFQVIRASSYTYQHRASDLLFTLTRCTPDQ